MSFMIKDDEVRDKYDKIWNVIKDKLGIKIHIEPVHEYKYLRAKAREFNDVIKSNFLGNYGPKENMHYTCIACITIDSVMKVDKKYFPQVYLEECKYKIKKIQMSTILVIIFRDILMFEKIFVSPQVKRIVIISNKHVIYQLPHNFTNDLRLTTRGN